ncbi:MAG: hypothetical protein EPN97_06530 [Alphaproteobacteria bacterium]|nr:MAG: hypothetical protein EPN97_06530 [Alphaproteobacteria bacterium]
MKKQRNIRHDLPVTVHAPVIVDASTDAGVQPLLDFVGALESHSNVEVAKAENQRLGPYFAAVSGYLKHVMNSIGPLQATLGPQHDSLEKLTTPGALSGLFNAAAERTHNTIISEVAILPQEILSKGPASFLFGDPQFKVHYAYGGHMFNFGFLQVHEGGDRKTAKSSTAFPTFILDNAMMKAVAPHQPEKMLRDFQAAISFVNHDMLHHYTTPIINPVVARKFRFEDVVGEPGKPEPIHAWYKKLPQRSSYNILYEEWAQMGHESAMLDPANAGQVADLGARITRYFNELKRIGGEMTEKKGVDEAHAAVDYFGMVMAHALTRVFPLNHPVMTHCLECLEAADPAPQRFLTDCEKTLSNKKPSVMTALRHYFSGLVSGAGQKPQDDSLTVIRQFAHQSPPVAGIMQAYKNLGFEVLPEDDKAVSHRNIKLLQLIQFAHEDIHPHVPKPLDPTMAEMKMKTGKAMLDMVAAASRSFDYTPKQ